MDTFNKIKTEAKKMFSWSKGSHDWEHTERVFKLALRIGKKEKADIETIKYAAILHDIARSCEDKSSGRIDHAERGAAIVGHMLKRHKFGAEKIKQITQCIASHRFRGKNRPDTLEAKVLFDADKLDSIGAVGIGRAFLFAGEIGAKLHNSKGTDISMTKPYTAEDTAYREYMVKLRKVKSRMLTSAGRRMAQKRHEYMKDFFERMNKEVEGIM